MLERYGPILAIIIAFSWCYLSLRWPFLMALFRKKHAFFWRDFGKINLLNLIVIPTVLYFILAFALVKDNAIVFQGLSYEMYDAIRFVCRFPLYTLATIAVPIIFFPLGLCAIVISFLRSVRVPFFPITFVVACFVLFFVIYLISSVSYAIVRTKLCHNPLNKKSILAYFLYLIYWILGTLCIMHYGIDIDY